MGKILFKDDKTKPYTSGDHNYELRDWFVGSLERFETKLAWIEQDYVDYGRKCRSVPRIEVRKYIEGSLEGDVFIYDESADTWMYEAWHKTSWLTFCFEHESDATLFKLAYATDLLNYGEIEELKEEYGKHGMYDKSYYKHYEGEI